MPLPGGAILLKTVLNPLRVPFDLWFVFGLQNNRYGVTWLPGGQKARIEAPHTTTFLKAFWYMATGSSSNIRRQSPKHLPGE